MVTGATPTSINGTLAKQAGFAGIESGESNDVATTFNLGSTHCRVAAYGLKNSGDGKNYVIEIPFAKTDGAFGLIRFYDDTSNFVPTYLVRTAGPGIPGLTVNTTARVITFVNVRFGPASGSNTVVINGTLEYPTNATPANRAACG